MLRISLLLAASTFSCAVVNPPGYDQHVAAHDRETLNPTAWVPFSVAPRSWDLPDGRKVRIEVEKRTMESKPGFRRPTVVFQLDTDEVAGAHRCETEPSDPAFSKARFACWAIDGADNWQYMVGGPECPFAMMSTTDVKRQPKCWSGQLWTEDATFRVELGSRESSGILVKHASWSGPDGVVLAADLTTKGWIVLYGAEALAPGLRYGITLNAIALHQWLHLTERM